MNKDRSRQVVIIAIVAFLIACFLAIAYALRQHSLSATVVLTVVPSESSITINGKKARNGVNHVLPGLQKITVTFGGFTTISKTVTVSKGDNAAVDIVLTSNSNATANWYLTHLKDAKTVEGLSDHEVDALRKQSVQGSPLILLLPFVSGGLEFRVDYGNLPGNNAGTPVIYISAPTVSAQQKGIAWIQSVGYNPFSYNIQFVTTPVQPLAP